MKDIGVSDIERVLTDLKSYYRARNSEVAIDVELYQQSYSLTKPKDVRQVLSPATKAICDRGADRLGGARIQDHMEARRGGETERKHVEMLEKAGPALVWLARKGAKYNPIRGMALHGLNRGGVCVKVQVNLDNICPKPDRKNCKNDADFKKQTKLWQYKQLARFPITLDVRPIESIFPDPATDGDQFVIEHYRRPVGDIKKNYPNWEGWEVQWTKSGAVSKRSRTFKDDEEVDFTEVTTCEWKAVVVEGQFVPIGDFEPGPVPNLFGRPNYFIRYSGFGDPAGKPEEKCVSILRAIRDVARSESVLLTVLNKLAGDEAWGATVIDSADAAARDTMAFGPAAIVETDMKEQGRRPAPLRKDNNLPSVVQGLQVMQRSAEMGAVPAEAIGQPSSRGGGPPSGVAAAILTGQASMVIAPLKEAIEDLLSDLIPFLLYICDVIIDAPVTVYGQIGRTEFVDLELDSETIGGHYGPVYVELKLQAPEQNFQAWNLGAQMLGVLGPDPYVFEKFFGMENAEAFTKDMLARQIAYSPEVMGYLKERLIAKLRAQAENVADAVPGSKVPAPAGFVPPQPGGGMAVPADGGLAGPPIDAAGRAAMGIPPAAQGAPTITAPML